MTKRITRTMAFVMAVLMVLTIAPMTAFAQSAQPTLVFCEQTQVYVWPEGVPVPRNFVPFNAPAIQFSWDYTRPPDDICCPGPHNPWRGATFNIRAHAPSTLRAEFQATTITPFFPFGLNPSGWAAFTGRTENSGLMGGTPLHLAVGFANAQGTRIRVTAHSPQWGYFRIIHGW